MGEYENKLRDLAAEASRTGPWMKSHSWRDGK